MGHRRLAIIDVAHGHQPMFNEDGSVAIVFNGEIYNFQDLVTELQAPATNSKPPATRSHRPRLEQWGEACVKRFRGMFVFALYDKNKHTLFVARDRLVKSRSITASWRTLFCFRLGAESLLVHTDGGKDTR
jgi:asparagine synthase (glutamine-hydrolysing)